MALLDDEDIADIDEALEIYWRWKRLKQKLKIERIRDLQGLTLEGLIMAAEDPEQQKLFFKLALEKIRGQLTPDRIAALRLGENPELDKTLKELILGLHDTGKLEQAEQLIKEMKEMRGEQREVYQSHLQALMQMFTQALGAARDIARGG